MAVARSSWQNWSVFLILFLFLAVAVVVRGRSWVRRGIAVTLVLTGLVVERGAAIVNVQVLSHFSEWLFGLSYLMSMAFFVGAWSVARRLSWASALGGVIGLVLACLALWLYHSTDYLGWFWVWIIDVGVFTVGCLSAWAVDALMPRSTPDQLPQNVGSQASW